MKAVRNIALAAAAAGALGLAGLAVAQETNKPDAKPQAGEQQRGEHRQHRGEHREGMGRMREMRGNCHGESRGAEHSHS